MRRGRSGLNLLLGIDKPVGMSSHDVVDVARRALGERRIGHAGTLDPLASGVLVLGVGQGTRLMGLLTADTKSYVASIRFGMETSTDDLEGEATTSAAEPEELSDPAYASRIVESFVGTYDQIPPAYSAISVDGRRAYARARAGESVELPSRKVEIRAAQLLGVSHEEGHVCWQVACTVSKGTYVRALARDIGRRAKSAAHLSRLCRTASGCVTLSQCAKLEQLEAAGPDGVRELMLNPVRALGLPAWELSELEMKAVTCGRRIQAKGAPAGSRYALVRDDRLWGVWHCKDGQLACDCNYPQGIEGIHR